MPAFRNIPSTKTRHSTRIDGVVYNKGQLAPITSDQIMPPVLNWVVPVDITPDSRWIKFAKHHNEVDAAHLSKADEQATLFRSLYRSSNPHQSHPTCTTPIIDPFLTPARRTFISSRTKTSRKSRRKDPNYIPRPRNAFILFRSFFTNFFNGSVQLKQNALSVVAAKVWEVMLEDDKQIFRDRAREEKELHKKRFPNYVYAPVARNGATRITRKTASSISTIVKKKASRSSSFAVSSAPSSDGDSSPELEVAAQQAVWRLAPAPSTPSERSSRSSSFSSPPPSKHDNFVPTDEIPVLSLTSKTPAPILVTGRKVLETSYVSSIHPHLDTESNFPDYFGSGSAYKDGFKPYFWQPEVMCDTNPVSLPMNMDSSGSNVEASMNNFGFELFESTPTSVSQTGPLPYLPYPDEFAMAAGGFLTDYASSSTSTPYTFGGVEFDSELDPISRSISALNLNYDYGVNYDVMDYAMSDVESEETYLNGGYFDSTPSDVRGKGKEKAV
ncbi:hypothetical protein CPB84DRAFT_1746282 [Gymnopilus junonius]|uniref:HMG box domain-containing protein n=1 Tax=Gymnopilus junonius TaxID=109634 RepID=A0A9P5NQV5_GYMJU|nr:hypothetical protein CPB84DRAFT_1746282 [Gymnopilus junonius]